MAATAWTLAAIVERLGGELRGDGSIRVEKIAPLRTAAASEIAYVANPRFAVEMTGSHAAALIVPPSLAESAGRACIVTKDPHLYFARVAQLLHPPGIPARGVHPSAVVLSPVPASAVVGPLSFVGENCDIGEGVVIGAHCTVQPGCSIGAGTRLHDQVAVYADCVIGERCILHSGTVIGSDGFGYARHQDGSWEKIPQIGRTILGNEVETGANVAIDRGAMDDTVIGDGVKLDNMVHIAHNVRIGDHTAIAGQSGVAGSSTVGKRVMVGGQSGIVGHIEVADDVILSGRSLISKTVTEPGVITCTLIGVPHNEWMRTAAHMRHLDDMAKRIKALEKKLEELEKPA